MREDLRVPVGVEEGREHPLPLALREALGGDHRQLERLVGGPARVVVELRDQDGREVDRRPQAVVLGDPRRHREIVAQRVQAYPRRPVAPSRRGARGERVRRLMLVPHQREVDAWPDAEHEGPRSLPCAGARRARGVLDAIASCERSELRAPVAVVAFVALPARLRPALPSAALTLDAPLDGHRLAGLDGPRPHAQRDAISR